MTESTGATGLDLKIEEINTTLNAHGETLRDHSQSIRDIERWQTDAHDQLYVSGIPKAVEAQRQADIACSKAELACARMNDMDKRFDRLDKRGAWANVLSAAIVILLLATIGAFNQWHNSMMRMYERMMAGQSSAYSQPYEKNTGGKIP